MLDVGNWAIGKTVMIAKVKAVDWRKPRSFQLPPSRATSLSREREQGATTSTLSDGQGALARALDEGVCVTPGTKEDCSSKSVGELCTRTCVSVDSNSVDLPQIFLCESNEDLCSCTELGRLRCQ